MGTATRASPTSAVVGAPLVASVETIRPAILVCQILAVGCAWTALLTRVPRACAWRVTIRDHHCRHARTGTGTHAMGWTFQNGFMIRTHPACQRAMASKPVRVQRL